MPQAGLIFTGFIMFTVLQIVVLLTLWRLFFLLFLHFFVMITLIQELFTFLLLLFWLFFYIFAFLHLCIWLLYCFSLTFSCFFILFVFVSTLIQGPPPNAGRTGAAHVNVEPKPEQGLGERAAAPNERELTRCRTSTVAENSMPGWSHIFGDKLLEISMGNFFSSECVNTGHDPSPRVGSGPFSKSHGRAELGRVGPGRVRSFPDSHGPGPVRHYTWRDPTWPARFYPAREKPW